MKIFQLTILLSLCLFLTTQQAPLTETNGTDSFFLSPHGLGRTPEVPTALDKIFGQVKVVRTTCNVSQITYIIDNVRLGIVYNPSTQNVTIPHADEVQVSGGKFEFTYEFNYTKIENRNNITGHAYGSVLSDGVTYHKSFSFCGGFLRFILDNSPVVQTKITEKNFTLKRMEPFNETDLKHLEDMLNHATEGIEPSNAKHQILSKFNDIFPQALNDSLNHQIFGENIDYTWHSSSHGEMTMRIKHQVHGFGIDPEKGYKIILVSLIQNFEDHHCDQDTVPLAPASFEIYGGSQAYKLNCLYQSVVFYLQSNGWLDTVLNSNWQVSSFQFYAGDLFDLINNLYIDFSPRSVLDGTCAAQKEGLEFISAREFDSNAYALKTTYKCSLKGVNLEGSTKQVLKFTANTLIYITAGVTTKTLTFKIKQVQIADLSFQTVDKYSVNNPTLAKWKVTQVVKKVENSYTFGTDFPTIQREHPKARVDRDYVFYYDNSHIDMTESFKTK